MDNPPIGDIMKNVIVVGETVEVFMSNGEHWWGVVKSVPKEAGEPWVIVTDDKTLVYVLKYEMLLRRWK